MITYYTGSDRPCPGDDTNYLRATWSQRRTSNQFSLFSYIITTLIPITKHFVFYFFSLSTQIAPTWNAKKKKEFNDSSQHQGDGCKRQFAHLPQFDLFHQHFRSIFISFFSALIICLQLKFLNEFQLFQSRRWLVRSFYKEFKRWMPISLDLILLYNTLFFRVLIRYEIFFFIFFVFFLIVVEKILCRVM